MGGGGSAPAYDRDAGSTKRFPNARSSQEMAAPLKGASGAVWDPPRGRGGGATSPAKGVEHPCERRPSSTCHQGSPPSRNPHPQKFLKASLGNHELVGEWGLLETQFTDLLEDLWAEPRQNLDTVLGKVVDHTLPLPVADHAEVAA